LQSEMEQHVTRVLYLSLRVLYAEIRLLSRKEERFSEQVVFSHPAVVDSSEGEDGRYDRIVQTEEVVVRFALPLLLVRVILRHRYSNVVRFHHSKVRGVRESQSLRIHAVALAPNCLSDLFSASDMHPAMPR
jgi:hypothetical protein